MKVGVSASGKDLNARVDNRFGRCPWFLVVESDSLKFAALENRHADEEMGAGVAAARDLIDAHVDTVISGQVGPRAYEVLRATNIDNLPGFRRRYGARCPGKAQEGRSPKDGSEGFLIQFMG